MSKIGKKPILIPEGVTVEVVDTKVLVSGPKGELDFKTPKGITVEVVDEKVLVGKTKEGKQFRASHGLMRQILANMIAGVSTGWKKTLELVGAGYRALVEDTTGTLVLSVGFSQPIKIPAPKGIKFSVSQSKITVEGIDKILVGQTAANIRAIRPPEPYKGKGIRYEDEVIRTKPGKAAKIGLAGVGPAKGGQQ